MEKEIIAALIGVGGSIIGGLIGGLFTYLGVKKTLRHEDINKKKEDLKQAYNFRPRLEIVSSKKCDSYDDETEACNDVIVLEIQNRIISSDHVDFIFDNSILDKKNIKCYEFVFKNIGLTEINDVSIISNSPRFICVFDYYKCKEIIDDKFINYDVVIDKKFIKQGDSFIIRICYLNGDETNDHFFASLSICMTDINGKNWRQPFFVSRKELENSTYISYDEYRKMIDTDLAEKCFLGKLFW